MRLAKLTASAIAIAAAATAAEARDQVQITGSSTVLPYATIVAEAFGENFDFPSPVVEGGGSGAGRKKMCEGVGENTVDIANSSSRISQSDIDLCAANGVSRDHGSPASAMTASSSLPPLNGAGVRTDPGGHVLWRPGGETVLKSTARLLTNAATASGPRSIRPFRPRTSWSSRSRHQAWHPRSLRHQGNHRRAAKRCRSRWHVLRMSSAEADEGAKEDAAEEACMEAAHRWPQRSTSTATIPKRWLASGCRQARQIGVFGLSFYQNNTDKLRVATMGGVLPSAETHLPRVNTRFRARSTSTSRRPISA